MVTQFGMSDRLGLVALEGQRQPVFLPVGGQSHKEYSEETARIVDEEIKLLLTDAHQKVRSFLSSCRDALEELAQLLLEKEVVERPALRTILNGRRTKDRDATDTVQQGQSPSDGPIGKSA
jgi:cell division protease FtsH